MASIALEGVGKTYAGGVKAVHSVDLAVPDGKFLVLVGPSGCGKSTLLRMIAGLEKITAGTIRIGDTVVNDMEPADRDIAMVFQNYALYPHMKVYDNMAYGLRNRGIAKGEIDERVRAAAATLEIGHLLDRRPRQLSGGQRQRVAMGRAIVRHPKAFLFDEPLSNLDAKLRGQMRVQIKNLQRSIGVTSVYVTHDQLEAMTMADILVVMNAGNVEQAGTALDVYEKPASTFVASFIGAPSMNLIALSSMDAGAGSDIAGFAVPQGAATLGFRPEDANIGKSGEVAAGADNLVLAATVEGVEPVGAESFLYCKTAGSTVVLRVAGRTIAAVGDALSIHVKRPKVHWFDQAGKRLPD